ncbi:M48 family metalloprotease [Nocardia sp. NPDC050175]|uniref:M48 family metalloprotease n=1 Tax=Nocardia sp. NPDC050175 TaxID=3364317 RepID=UPI0037B4CC38
MFGSDAVDSSPEPQFPLVGLRWRIGASVAALVVSLPSLVLSALIVVAIPYVLLAPWVAVATGAIWLLSGAVLFSREEAMLARLAFRFRRPTGREVLALATAWDNVTRAARVDGSVYSLWIEDSRAVNAFAGAGHVVGVTKWAVLMLGQRQLEAVLAHELGHHLDGRWWMDALVRWYSLPFSVAYNVVGQVVMLPLLGIARVVERNELTSRIVLLMVMVAVVVAPTVVVGMTVGLVFLLTPLVGLSAALWLTGAFVVEESAQALLSRRREALADRVAVDLGYGRELRGVLSQHADSAKRAPLWWLGDTHPPVDARSAAITDRMDVIRRRQ